LLLFFGQVGLLLVLPLKQDLQKQVLDIQGSFSSVLLESIVLEHQNSLFLEVVVVVALESKRDRFSNRGGELFEFDLFVAEHVQQQISPTCQDDTKNV
jgi:hypothetical protein